MQVSGCPPFQMVADTARFARELEMAQLRMTATVEFTNAKALRALRCASELLEELEEDFPYRPEVKQARKAIRYAMRHINVRIGSEK